MIFIGMRVLIKIVACMEGDTFDFLMWEKKLIYEQKTKALSLFIIIFFLSAASPKLDFGNTN